MRKRTGTYAWAVIIVLIIIALVVWYLHSGGNIAPQQTPATAATVPQAPAAPAIAHPISAAGPAAATTVNAPLPKLGKSDPAVASALERLSGDASMGKLLATHTIPRLVAMIDALPRHDMGSNVLALRPPQGQLATNTVDGQLVLAPSNASRYAPYMAWVHHANVHDLVAWYVHYYPLFQQAYRKLGYPHGYFNDRLVEVIDNLLKAPAPANPPALVRTDKGYKFADPQLEALSVGQKLMVRVGRANEKQLKQKLRAIRAAITGEHAPHP